MSGISVGRLDSGEMSAALTLLSHAFLTQPNNVAVWRSQDERARRKIERLFRVVKLERSVAEMWGAWTDGRLVGALNMTAWPRCQMSSFEMLAVLPRLLVPCGIALRRVAVIQSAWKRQDPGRARWHLGPVGVAAGLQGRGIGSRLLETCCAMFDERNEAGYLETDRPENVPFYQRFGFSVTATESILCVPNWFMWREPR
jgi:ribosomal protein S18 acetylase RimI-like enzyme